ncbi:hypothetical protein A6A06_15005 [Streptomyces sp. CB02923]|uniref:DUF4394 domain-containing protein n=1 Tax=Streptomyces sp. CB02923 TaxID=1718985 RepID=UPI00093A6639|nr:DUF4394 domain-containing protein [Streptomyces sp. CB02923]OKI02354.1 hypothetical protein A6A06_15005 [Streptomyces sp. CB02923]
MAAGVVMVTSATLMFGVPGSGSAAPATPSLNAFGISANGKLMASFTTDRPDILGWVKAVTGLSGDTSLIGIDFRVQDGLLYGVGNKGGIYTIKTPPATKEVVVTKVSQLQYDLRGTAFGVDFNPAADRLRVISDNGQNLRHNLNNHTTVQDQNLNTPPDEGATKGVTAAAYTNNDVDAATATTLADINTLSDQVVLQSPANSGTLVPTGSLGVDAGLNAGLDIYSTLSKGKTVDNAAFATLTPYGASTSSLYSVNVFTGQATAIEQFPLEITDLAISLTGS